ncbi:hypothetical protein [Tenggerimyces flavus]|uniref:Uncharacterized protein n=1 Tax=Tenggerimyces flavus TaxID=1708749 RepID=A0ABV7YJX9_9ACTN|nr:hypothetical protein [Tenggerimyces flavus]MBM7784823.1 hypothetical protein [Tenggerimyces flavus]
MHAADLAAAVDALPSPQRTHRIAVEARRLLGSPELRELLDELAAGDLAARQVGLVVAEAAGDAAYLERALDDPAPAVQRRAISVAANLPAVSDEALARGYADAPAWRRKWLARVVRRSRRGTLASMLLDVARAQWGDDEAVGLFTACDSATIARLLPDLDHLLGVGDWSRLGARHAELLLTYAESVLPKLGDDQTRAYWWSTAGAGVVAAAEHQPERAWRAIEQGLPRHALPPAIADGLGRFAGLDPEGTLLLRLLTTPERADAVRAHALRPSLLRRLRVLTDEQVATIGRIVWANPRSVQGVLEALPPLRRAAVFGLVTRSLDLSQTVIDEGVLDALPHDVRHRHAQRMLGVPAVRESTAATWRVTAQLAFDEAFTVLQQEVRRADAGERAAVYRAILTATGRSRSVAVVRQTAEWLARLRNDQDPVRQAALQGVAELPPSLLAGDQVPAWEVLLTDALNARDCSWGTRHALTSLAESAVRQGALRGDNALLEWGIQAHERIAGQSGVVSLSGLCDGLPRGREREVYARLRGLLDAYAARDQWGLAFQAAWAFGKRAYAIDHLQDLLARAARSEYDGIAQSGISLWLRDPAKRGERTEQLLTEDLQRARWGAIWAVVTERRTDLLDPILADPDQTLRFSQNHPAWYVRPSALRRWLPRQHVAYRDLLDVVARDSELPVWTRSAAVGMIGRLPMIGLAAVRPFLESAEVPIAEAALGSLAWVDQPAELLPELLQFAGDDLARVATYAATRAARYVPPSQLAGMLRPLLVGDGVKITSRKEAARLLGEHRPPGAMAILAEAWPSAHRDVQAAITSVVSRRLLDDSAAWPLLDEAAAGPTAAATTLAGVRPYDVAERHRVRFAGLIAAVSQHPERDVAQLGFHALGHWVRQLPSAPALCRAALVDLDRPWTVWQAACSSLVSCLLVVPDSPELPATIRDLLAADPGTPDAGAERDRPALRRLGKLVDDLVRSAIWSNLRTALLAAASALADAPFLLQRRIALLVAAVPWSSPAPALTELAGLVADRPAAAVRLAGLVPDGLHRNQAHWHPADLEPAIDQLAARVDLAGGLLALHLTHAAGHRLHWPAEWRARLVALRAHPHPDVREATLDIATASS